MNINAQAIWDMERPGLIPMVGHRGMARLFPENTIPSFKEALDARLDLVEFDVHLTKDGVPVVCHDATVDRTTNGSGFIRDMTLAQIKQLDAGIKKGARFAGIRIPTLHEVLSLLVTAEYPLLLNVEMKVSDPAIVDATVKMLKEFGLDQRSVIASFLADMIDYTQKTYPDMKTQGQPWDQMRNKDGIDMDDLFNRMWGMGIPLRDDETTLADVEFAKAHGCKRWMYQADSVEAMDRAIALGCTNITANNPYPALRRLRELGLQPAYPNVMPEGTMKVASLRAVGDLVVEERPIPLPEKGEVLVQIKACGVCGSDIGRILSHGTYHFPTVPGHEFAGKVVYDPEGKLAGTRVAVFPLLPCMKCRFCQTGDYAQCVDYDYYGSRRDGGFGEYLCVKRENLITLPDNVTYEEGAMTEPASVGLHAVKKLGLKGGEHLLITGAGTIGLIAGMLARHYGASRISYIDLDPVKIEYARSLGFDIWQEGEEVDCTLEGTGASSALATAVSATRAFGTVVLMGNPGRDIAMTAKIYQTILRKELTVKGTWNSSFAPGKNDWEEILALTSNETVLLRPLITHRVSLEELLDSVKMMQDRNETYFKVEVCHDR